MDPAAAPPAAAATGYTLPVWLAAAARAALACLRGEPAEAEQPLLLEAGASQPTAIPVEAAAPLGEGWALGVSRCDPGPGVLDLTRGLAVWALLRWQAPDPAAGPGGWLRIEAGEGAGVVAESGRLCLSAYARALLERSLRPLVPQGQGLLLQVVLPQGRRLAERTSNAAFGVVEGLALIGTQAEVQRSAGPDPLQQCLQELERRTAQPEFRGDLVLVIGENGLDLAPRLGLPAPLLLKAGNWLGPLLVAAGAAGVERLLLFGYIGKLLKLAGGIFHTHHHLADGRAEVLTALAALEGLPHSRLEALHGAPTVAAALDSLAREDPAAAVRLRQRIAAAVETRSRAYLGHYGQERTLVGAALFDRGRSLCGLGPVGHELWRQLGGGAPPRLPAEGRQGGPA
ncbi:MAG: cobalt-precorrin-5B (C(1))-methyltransferase CbiD [Prochlorococcaceae cyanobacterium]|jgi:cobalt-precorrin-5B (C1)-methyltransferase